MRDVRYGVQQSGKRGCWSGVSATAAVVIHSLIAAPAWAQQPPAAAAAAPTAAPTAAPSPFALDILRGAISDGQSKGGASNLTVVPRQSPAAPQQGAADSGEVTLVGLVTEDGQRINETLVWRVFEIKGPDGKPRLVSTQTAASPKLRLAPGDYYVNAAFGRANITRRITVAAAAATVEQFALNVGLLRVRALLGGKTPLPPGAVSLDVLADERDKFGEPSRVVTNAKTGVLIRLNSGLYHVVSRYGDANAVVRADMTVEPGKLTEATVIHHAARITFKLVTRPGGDATPDTHWSIVDREGDIVKESAGAFPTHTLAPGTYTVTARSQGRVYRQQFAIKSGESKQVEVVMR